MFPLSHRLYYIKCLSTINSKWLTQAKIASSANDRVDISTNFIAQNTFVMLARLSWSISSKNRKLKMCCLHTASILVCYWMVLICSPDQSWSQAEWSVDVRYSGSGKRACSFYLISMIWRFFFLHPAIISFFSSNSQITTSDKYISTNFFIRLQK